MFNYSDSIVGFIPTHFVILTSFMGIQNSVIILYKASLITESFAVLESINS